MIVFSERPSIDPDNPESRLLASPVERKITKLGPSASQGARSELVNVVPLSRPASLAPKATNEPARRARDLDRLAELLSVAGRIAAVAGAVAIVALLFMIVKPASRQSVASSTPSDTTGSTPQSNQGGVKSKPALAESEAVLASPPSQPATHEESQQLLQRFLQWREKADTTGGSASSAQPQ